VKALLEFPLGTHLDEEGELSLVRFGEDRKRPRFAYRRLRDRSRSQSLDFNQGEILAGQA
jgi:hypothetical protein